MTFKVQDLMTQLTPVGMDEGDTCSGVTRIRTGCKMDSLYEHAPEGALAAMDLDALKAQLREAVLRA